MAKKYISIVFMQGYDAQDALAILSDNSFQACIDYLKQWEDCMGEEYDAPRWGSGDDLFKSGDYVLSWNRRLEYVSLTRVEKA